MPVIDVQKSVADLSMTMIAEFDATVEQVWRLWADAELFERWWGPPGFSVSLEEHDFTPGGRIGFSFVSPEGEKFPQEWQVLEVDAPRRVLLRDADVAEDGTPNDGNGMTGFEITVAPAGAKTRMQVTSRFHTLQGMEETIAMGVEEGLVLTLAKADAALAEVAAA